MPEGVEALLDALDDIEFLPADGDSSGEYADGDSGGEDADGTSSGEGRAK